MAFTATTADKESLQTLACAVRQTLPGDITPDILSEKMETLRDLDVNIKRHCFIDYAAMEKRFSNWVTGGAEDWIESSCYIANKAHGPFFKQATYNFYRQDLVPDFKGTYNKIRGRIKQKASRQMLKKMYSVVGMSEDKWNPADIIAIKHSQASNVFNQLKNFKATKNNQMSRDVEVENRKLKAGMPGESAKNIQMMQDLDEMYEYNQLIDDLFTDKTCMGVSLKKALSPSVKTAILRHKKVKGMKEALNMKIEVTEVKYLESNQKCLVYFNLADKKGHYLDIRGFESSKKIADIQVQLSKTGSSAAHGKITLPVITLITKKSLGGRAFIKMKSERNKIFKKTFQKSGIHSFTDWKIFDSYTKKGAEQMLLDDLQGWSQYINFLSNKKHTTKHVIDTVMEMVDKKQIFKAAKFLKHKVQSYEVGYMLDKDQKAIKEHVQNNIIKSMVAYAGSKGMFIFTNNTAVAFMTSSTYLKMGG